MDLNHIKELRLVNQQLAGTRLDSPAAMVSCFGAMQAQDYAMAKWGIGVRLGATEQAIEAAINQGDIVRTHILRPTWHLVAATDIHWMLALTAPHVKTLLHQYCRNLGLDIRALQRCCVLIEKMLAGNKHLTRDEIMAGLSSKNTDTTGTRPAMIMMYAELEGLVCNGQMKGKQSTYALLEEKIPKPPAITKEEGLAALAMSYFTSHGPATLQDFGWWSGLSVIHSKTALELVKDKLQMMTTDDRTYWYTGDLPRLKGKPAITQLLPAFDEFLISYKDRSAMIAPEHQPRAFTRNGIFNPVMISNGQVTGTWKRTIKKDKVIIEVHPFQPLQQAGSKRITAAAAAYGKYLNMTVDIQGPG